MMITRHNQQDKKKGYAGIQEHIQFSYQNLRCTIIAMNKRFYVSDIVLTRIITPLKYAN